MTQAVIHCHEHDVIHKDVKLDNFLVKKNDDQDLEIKLADFGLACSYDKHEPPTDACGSLASVAPEILTRGIQSPKIDCWALGIILH